MSFKTILQRVFAAGALAVAVSPMALGAVVNTTGAVMQIAPPPPSVMPDVNEDNNHIWLFTEKTGYTLTSPLHVNVHTSGYYNNYTGLLFTLPKGLRVDVYYMRFDPGPDTTKSGSVTFDTPILGIIVHRSELHNSNYLGAPGTVYPGNANSSLIGLENWQDKIGLSLDMKTLTVDWRASSPGDRIRIITLSAIPEPTSLLLFAAGLAGAGLGVHRRRRA
jgi:hypothetical protein